MILVTGATGTVGREVVAQLVAAGESVRAMSRNPTKASLDSKVEVVKGDFDEPETLAGAVQGTDAVFSLTFGPQTEVHERNLARAAKAAGVRKMVKLSAMGGDGGGTRNDIRKWHDDGEQAIRDAGLPLTVLHPGGFMSNALFWRDSIRSQGKVFSNYGDGKYPPIHPRDIAAVAVRALTSDHAGKSYSMTGPEALSVAEQVEILARAIGKPIEFSPITDDDAREGMERAGMPGFLIDALLPFASFIRSGKAARVLPTVEEITGRAPLTFRDWARENAAAF